MATAARTPAANDGATTDPEGSTIGLTDWVDRRTGGSMPSAWRRLVVCGAPDCSVRCGRAGPAVEGEDAGGTLLEGLVAAGGGAVTGGAGAGAVGGAAVVAEAGKVRTQPG